jgi:O-antigen/teichoic acid export membrane protein
VSVARRIGGNMVAAVAGKALVAVAGLITLAIMTRELGTSDFGVVRTAQNFVLFAGALAHLGLHYVMVREVSVDEQHAKHIIASALCLRLIVAIGAMAVAIALAVFGPWNHTVLMALLIAAAGMLAFQGNEIITAVLQWRLSQTRATLAEVVGTVTATALTAILVTSAYFGVLTVTAVNSFGLMVTFLLAWYLANRLTPVGLAVDLRQWQRLASAGLPMALSSYLSLISLRGDTLLLSLLKPAADVGLYGVSSKIYEIGLQIPIIFSGLLMPTLSRSAANADPQVLRDQVTHGLHALIIVGVAIALALGFFAREIVVLLAGDGFASAAPAVQLMGVSLALAGYSTLLRYTAMAQQTQRQVLVADCVTTVISVCAYLFLIPRLSFVGAALGTLIAELVLIGGLLTIVARYLHALPWSNRNLRALGCGLVVGASLHFMRINGVPVLAMAATGAVIYPALLLATGAVTPTMLRALLTSSAKG